MEEKDKEELETKLKNLFQYIINQRRGRYIEQNIIGKMIEDKNDVHFRDAPQVFRFMVELFGFNAFPQIVKNKDFGKINSHVLYRGVRDIKHAQNLLNDDDYHFGMGEGKRINGIYSALKKQYAQPFGSFVFKFKLDENSMVTDRLIYPDNLINTKMTSLKTDDMRERANVLFDFANKIKTENQRNLFYRIFIDYPELFLIYLGFDAYQAKNGDYVIFNRNKIVFSQNQANLINHPRAETSKKLEVE